jgi:hypothetical protein
MKNFLVLSLIALSLAACSSITTTGPVVPPSAVATVTPNKATLEINKTQQLSAVVENASTQKVTWNSDLPNIASVSSNGLVTALVSGIAYVCATPPDLGATKGCSTITVTATPALAVAIAPLNIALEVGKTQAFVATVQNASNNNVVWVSNNPNIATVSSIGVVTAVSVGLTKVCAESEQQRTVKGCADVTVTTPTALPADPTTLSISSSASAVVLLVWPAVSGATEYVVDRKTTGVYTTITTTTQTSYSDYSPSFSTTYTYRVQAKNSAGTSSGIERNVTTPATGGGGGGGCCKVCTTGKPCGDTCIAASKTCHTPGGCACSKSNAIVFMEKLKGCAPMIPLFTVDEQGMEHQIEHQINLQ